MEGVFAYWEEADTTILTLLKAFWLTSFPAFDVFTDRDVLPLVQKHFPEFFDLYRSIRIPAAKADLARVLLLHEFGGLYVDCHTAIGDRDAIKTTFAMLTSFDVVFVDRRIDFKPRPLDQHWLINSMIFSRPGCDIMHVLARQAFENLHAYRANSSEFRSIWALCGPGNLMKTILQPGSSGRDIRHELQDRVATVREEDVGIIRHACRTYAGPGRHWSEREKREPLFRKSDIQPNR